MWMRMFISFSSDVHVSKGVNNFDFKSVLWLLMCVFVLCVNDRLCERLSDCVSAVPQNQDCASYRNRSSALLTVGPLMSV